MESYEKLVTELKTLAKYGSALSLLSWDEEVNLPARAHSYRGEVNALLSSDFHNRLTKQETYDLVAKLSEPGIFSGLSDDQKTVVRETKRDLDMARKLPTEFVEKMSLLTTKAFGVWVEARKKQDFALFAPILEEMLAMKKREAELLGYKTSPYDALLDEFEPGMTTGSVDAVFKPLGQELSKLIASVKSEPAVIAASNYPKAAQEVLSDRIARQLGYDMDAGRIDVSPHPFTISFHTTDVRVTTRYDETDFWVSLGSTIHEVGHGLYEQGLPEEHFGTPLGEAVSLGIHESQSRSWENFVGRSRAFANYLHPVLTELFPGISYSPEQLYRWLNRVRPNLIRVESDEVTYNMHIILRYELEKALIEGDLNVADLPAAWNEKVKKYLGLDVPNDALGVLQDVHWSHGSIGYFPTYTLGNLYAAQFFNAAKKALPDMEKDFAAGNFSGFLGWLRENIHSQGRRYTSAELVKKVTGEELNAKYLLDHLREKVALAN